MKALYEKPRTFIDTPTRFCPGCGHGIVLRLIAEIIDAWGIRGKTIGLAPVGCAVLAYNYLDIDMCEAAHGRPPAVATGIKRVHPDHVVFAYQGDGDLAAIGTAEIIHAANRGENITFIFVNNAVYGMTNGQMAPTTLVGQKTATTPSGRDSINYGHPIRVCELLSVLGGSSYLERVSLSSPENVRKTKKALEKGFKTQIEKRGFSLIEILSPCPIYWRMDANEAMRHIDEEMSKTFPLGVVKDWTQ
ncbi:MAG: 2-oxoglutarate oxidoreductase [Candidatus Brocadia sp. UTAMX1]|jgi:2-oxoglutarate ferredoxin oxidoreductase subunit beta|nr:MAG: 2-oxoglutarate oxidoreductase [Candidatus Brocadia sp. UTAMX1]